MCFSVYIGYGLLNVNQAFQTRLPGPGDHLILVLIQISINFSHFNFLTTQQSFSTRIDLTLHVAVIQSPALHLEGFFQGNLIHIAHTQMHIVLEDAALHVHLYEKRSKRKHCKRKSLSVTVN